MSVKKNVYHSVFAPGLFRKKIIVVTGGGSGLGRCFSHELASLGAQVVILGRTVEKLEAVVAEILKDWLLFQTHL